MDHPVLREFHQELRVGEDKVGSEFDVFARAIRESRSNVLLTLKELFPHLNAATITAYFKGSPYCPVAEAAGRSRGILPILRATFGFTADDTASRGSVMHYALHCAIKSGDEKNLKELRENYGMTKDDFYINGSKPNFERLAEQHAYYELLEELMSPPPLGYGMHDEPALKTAYSAVWEFHLGIKEYAENKIAHGMHWKEIADKDLARCSRMKEAVYGTDK